MRLKDDLFATERSQSHASGIRRASRASGGYWRLGQLCPPPLPPLPPPQPPCRRTWGRALFMDGAGCATTLAGRAGPGVNNWQNGSLCCRGGGASGAHFHDRAAAAMN